MKKILLSLMLSTGTLLAMPAAFANTQFSATEMAKVQLSSLSFKDLMRQFYSGKMVNAFVDDEEIEKMPYIGLGGIDKDGTRTVAVMHPVMQYHNISNQPRYLLFIEKVKVTDEGSLVACHACPAEADLFSFKKLTNGHYQLVSRSAKDAEFSSSWGRVSLDLQEIAKKMQPLGKNLVGSIFQNSYSAGGTTEMWWEALHLSENELIDTYLVADAGSDNAGTYEEDSPLYYRYEAALNLLNNGDDYFPIKVTYSGEKPTEDYEYIRKINYTEQVTFNPMKKKYQ